MTRRTLPHSKLRQSGLEVPYGAVGRIDMNHGVAFRMCLLPVGPSKAEGDCSGKEVVLATQ